MILLVAIVFFIPALAATEIYIWKEKLQLNRRKYISTLLLFSFIINFLCYCTIWSRGHISVSWASNNESDLTHVVFVVKYMLLSAAFSCAVPYLIELIRLAWDRCLKFIVLIWKIFTNNILPKKQKMQISLCIGLLVSFSIFVYGPVSMFLQNTGGLYFQLSAIMFFVIGYFILGTVAIFLILRWLPQPLFWTLTSLLFGICVGFYVEANLFNADYGYLNGSDVDWSGFGSYGAINSIIWIILVAAPFVLVLINNLRTKVNLRNAFVFGSVLLIGVQAIFMVFLGTSGKDNDMFYGARHIALKEDGLYEYSNEANILVIILDAYDAEPFERALSEEPELAQSLEGFTYYNNCLGGAQTDYAIPALFTGLRYDKSYDSYFSYKEAIYRKKPLFRDLKQAGYDLRVFTAPMFMNESLGAYINNMYLDYSTNTNLHTRAAIMARMIRLGLCNSFPHYLKQHVWISTGEFSKLKASAGNDYYIEGYDHVFYENLRNGGITTIEDKAFKMIHLFGIHNPLSMNENSEKVESSETDLYRAARGSLKVVFELFRQMKEFGIYDKSDIIIMGDHGNKELQLHPVLLVKEAYSTNDALETSNAPVTILNIAPTVMSFITDDYREVYGDSVFDVENDPTIERRYFTEARHWGVRNYTQREYEDRDLVEFIISGDLRGEYTIKAIE